MNRAAGLLLVAGFIGATASAQTAAKASECSGLVTTYEINQCLVKEIKKANIELSYAYERAFDAIDANNALQLEVRTRWKASLVRAERAWIVYRDAECRGNIAYQWWGGSGSGTAVGSCELAMIRGRARELQKVYGAPN